MKKENVASGAHIAYLRRKRGLTQPQLAAIVSEMVERPKPYTTTIVSAWETGRRTPSMEAAQAMSNLFNATPEYILGKTNIMNEASKDMDVAALNHAKLSFDDLSAFHGMPVYITFTDMQHKDCWGICNCVSNTTTQLLTVHGTFDVTKKTISSYNIFAREIDNANVESAKRKNNLGIIQILESTKPVYIQMISSDVEIRAAYDGWYQVTKDGRFLQGDSGKVLPISGLHIQFNCYSDI